MTISMPSVNPIEFTDSIFFQKRQYAEVGTYTIAEYESPVKITDAQILQGEVEIVDNYTLKITTQVKPKTYTTDLLIRTATGLQTIEVKTRA